MVSQTSRNSKVFFLTINTQVHTSHCQCRSRAAGDRCSHRAHRCGPAAACLSMQCAHWQSLQMHSSAKKEGFLFQSFPILFTFRTGPGDYEVIIPSTLIPAQTLVTIHFLFPPFRSVFPKPNSAPTIIIKRASGQVTEAKGDRAAIWGSLRVAAQGPPQVF